LLPIDSTALLNFQSIDLALTVHEVCKLAAILRHCAQSTELQTVEKQDAFSTLELLEAAHLA
jgi:hypothetical protein